MMVFLGQIPPLNLIMRLGELVRFLRGKDYVTWPKLMKADQPGQNTTLYWNFQKDMGHTTGASQDLKKKEIHNIIHKGYLKEFQRRSVQKFASDLSTSDYQPVVNKEAFCLDQYVQKEQSIYRRSVFEGRKITARNITPENSCSIRWTWFPLGKICQSSSPTKIVKVCHAYTKMPWS